MPWTVILADEFASEFDRLPDAVQDELLAQAHVLERLGPQTGRPRVDTLWRGNGESDMARTLKVQMARLPAARRRKVKARARALVAEEMSLRDLRKALAKTQTDVARVLGVGQDTVSRYEQRTDLLLSTLRGYVHAMGGELSLVAQFPTRPPVRIKALADIPARRAG